MADAHHTVLGFDASQAISTLSRLEQATTSYAAGVDIATGSIINYNRVAKQTDAGLKKNAANMSLVSQSMNDFGKTASKLPPSHPVSQALRTLDADAKKASQSLTLTWKSMARIFTIQALHGAISKLTSLLSESVEEARAFGIAIAEVETIAGPLGLTFEQLAEQARGVAEAIGAPLDVVAEAQYQLYSNQVGGAVESTLALESASKLSIAAVTSLNDAVAVTTGVMNSYGMSAARAEEISAKLFRTVELGRVRAAELANTLGRTTVIAAQLGVSYEEVLTSIATMTIQGQKASDAQTRLTQVMLKLIKPTDAMKEAFRELGIVSAEAGIQAFGFQGFLEKLRETTDGSVTEFAQLFGRVRATAGALGLTGKAAERYRENLEKINATTTELLDQKVEIIMQTNAKQVEKELNALHVNTIVNFGTGLNDLLASIFQFFGGAVKTINSLAIAAGAAGVAFLLMRAHAIAAATSTVTGMAAARAATVGLLSSMKALALGPAGIAIAVGAATALIIGYFSETQAEANKTLDLLKEFREKELSAQLRAQDKAFKARQKNNNKIISETQRWLTGIVKLQEIATEKASDLEQRATESLNNQLSNRASALQSYVGSIINLADTLDSRLKKLDESSQEVARNIEDFQFGRGLRDLNDVQKIYALINKAQDLRKQSTAAIRRGENELAESLAQQSQDYATQGLQIADNTKNRASIIKAEHEVLLSMGQQQTLNFAMAKQEEARKKLAEEQLPALLAQSNQLGQLIDKLKQTEIEIKKGGKSEKEIQETLAKRLSITKEIEQVQAQIAKGADVAAELGLEDQLDAALKAVREGITGQEMNLSEIITFEAEAIVSALNLELNKIDAARLTKLEIAFEVKGAADVAAALTQQPAILEAANEQLEKNRVLASEVRSVYVDILGDMVDLETALDSDTDAAVRMLNRFKEISDSTAKLIQDLPTVAGALGGPAAEEGIKKLEAMAAAFKRAGDIKSASVVSDAAIRLQEALTKFSQIQISTEGMEANQRIRDVGEAAQESGTQTDSATTSINDNLSSITQNAIRAANALALVRLGSAGSAQTVAHGALYLAGGGFTPRGTDRIAAMLSRGESVNTSDSTRQFASQIQAMNAGVTPVYRDAGGTVSVGDVNISVQGAPTPQQTAREVMTAFRREMRRKTSSF
jgi:TP901 family phage tail tape measure protein